MKLSEVIKALEDGVVLQIKYANYDRTWRTYLGSISDFIMHEIQGFDASNWRIKPDPVRELVPFTKDDFPREAWIRSLSTPEEQHKCIGVKTSSFFAYNYGWNTYESAARNYEYSLDHGKTWNPCGKWVTK